MAIRTYKAQDRVGSEMLNLIHRNATPWFWWLIGALAVCFVIFGHQVARPPSWAAVGWQPELLLKLQLELQLRFLMLCPALSQKEIAGLDSGWISWPPTS